MYQSLAHKYFYVQLKLFQLTMHICTKKFDKAFAFELSFACNSLSMYSVCFEVALNMQVIYVRYID